MEELNESWRELSSLRRHGDEDFPKILLFIFPFIYVL